MDFYDCQSVQPISHFEYVASEQFGSDESLKQRVYLSMDQLEGWCPKQKASILINLILMIKPKIVVEIGVFGGKSLVPMAYALKQNGFGKIYGIDPWTNAASVEGMDGVNKEYWGSVNHIAIMQGLILKIREFGLEKYVKLIRDTSAAASPIPDIDILHIDGNHSEETSYIDATKWVPLVRKGGLVIFDDTNWSTTKKAVEWVDLHCIKLAEFKGNNIWGIWVKP